MTEAPWRYAFVNAILCQLVKEASLFDSLPETPGQTTEETILAQELSTNFRIVEKLVLRKISEYYRGLDIDASPGKAILAYMEELLPWPNMRILDSVSMESILAVDMPRTSIGAAMKPEAQQKLLAVLETAALLSSKRASSDGLAREALVGYLRNLDSLPTSLELDVVTMHTDCVVQYLDGCGEKEKSGDVVVDLEEVYAFFKHLLQAKLDFTSSSAAKVAELRELGNNLAANQAYPQAVKVYTNAIDICDFASSHNLPQLYTNRAIVFIGLNCFPEAVSDLKTAVLLDRTFTPAWAQLGYCFLFMGSSLLALRCYLTALRAMVGEIFPDGFPVDEQARAEYSEARVKSIMPQFVQKLVQSFIFTERRADQQRELQLEIQETTTRVRAILARLRATALLPEDMCYFAYSLENETESLRSQAARANRMRPSILTPDVAQDVMAGTNVEASAVGVVPSPAGGPPAGGPPTGGPIFGTGPVVHGIHGAVVDAASGVDNSASLRGLFNNLGEIIGDAVQPFTQPRPETSTTATTQSALPESSNGSPGAMPPDDSTLARSESLTPGAMPFENSRMTPPLATRPNPPTEQPDSASPASSRGAPIAVNPPQPHERNSQTGSDFRNTIRSFVPDLRGNLGSLINQAMRHHHDAIQSRQLQRPRAGQLHTRVVRVDRNGTNEYVNGVPVRPPTRDDPNVPDAPDVD